MIWHRLSRFVVPFSALVFLAGCAVSPVSLPEPPPPPPPVELEAKPVEEVALPPGPLPTLSPAVGEDFFLYAVEEEKQVSRRLSHYQEELANWQGLAAQLDGLLVERRRPAEWNQCLDQLERLTNRYRRVRDRLRDLQFGELSQWPAVAAGVNAAYRADLEFGASECGEIHRLARETAELGLSRFHTVAAQQMQAVVLHHAEAGRVGETLQALENLERVYPESGWEGPLLRQVSIALTRGGAGDEALRLLAGYEAQHPEPEALFDPARLRADLLLIAGRDGEALRHYERVAARHTAQAGERRWVEEQLEMLRGDIVADNVERGLYLEVLRDYLLFDGRTIPTRLPGRLERLERLYPGGMLTHRARLLAAELDSRAGEWLDRQFSRVENLLVEREYDEAIARLEGLLAEELTVAQRDQVRGLLTMAMGAKQEEEVRRKQLESQALAIQWEEANRLLGLRRLEEAIQIFSRLLDSEYGDEARRLMREAGEEAAAEVRREAAGLFVRARRSENVEQGRELAMESWRLLGRIIERYPDSEIVGRVRDNLQSVEEYLESLEPGLVERLRGSGAEFAGQSETL
ncbi:hypothetical protein ACHHRT_13535 [Desulfurivibrio sp. D14AmB]|uniref:hypothetical protein n=1 Tax=Desulfurivibrio sp. D14AmB TaxID=3374370 RepID=UPI00376EA138